MQYVGTSKRVVTGKVAVEPGAEITENKRLKTQRTILKSLEDDHEIQL
jgi:hypothetical protein